MKKLVSEKTFCYIFHGFAIVMFGILFCYSLTVTGKNSTNWQDEYIYLKNSSVLLNGILLCAALFCLFFIGKISEKLKTRKIRNLLLGIVCALSAVIGLYWVFSSKLGPWSDQLLVCWYARDMNNGDFSALQEASYLTRYSQQLGMLTLLRIIFAVFGEMNYQAFQYMSAFMVPLLVLSGCKIVRILSNDNVKAELYYLFFIFFCFPMYVYTSWVYGDLVSTVLVVFGVWMYLSCRKQFSWVRLVLLGISVGLAVALRENQLILVVALAIVMLIKLIFDWRKENLFMILALLFGVLLMHAGIWALYHNVRNEECPSIPALLYVVMGLNDDYQRAGWHNNYEYKTFVEMNDNVELATRKAFQDLQMYLQIYKNDPHYMVDFFTRKMNMQWNAPMYQSLSMNNYIMETQLFPADKIYDGGRLTKLLELGMKIYQLLMYGSILFLLIVKRKDFIQIDKYVLLIGVFGGFLFTLIWEAKTRYVLPYLFMQIPYMAIGISEIISRLETKFVKNRICAKR